MKMMKCNQCGKELEPEVTWYGEVLQVLWYCEEHRCGWVKDIYFTRSDYPSPFSDANLRVEQAIGDLLEEQIFAAAEELPLEGCPTDEEVQLAQDAADQEQEERDTWYETHGTGKDWRAHANGRGYGNFPEDDEIPYEFL